MTNLINKVLSFFVSNPSFLKDVDGFDPVVSKLTWQMEWEGELNGLNARSERRAINNVQKWALEGLEDNR